jgi:hypothetical protein
MPQDTSPAIPEQPSTTHVAQATPREIKIISHSNILN